MTAPHEPSRATGITAQSYQWWASNDQASSRNPRAQELEAQALHENAKRSAWRQVAMSSRSRAASSSAVSVLDPVIPFFVARPLTVMENDSLERRHPLWRVETEADTPGADPLWEGLRMPYRDPPTKRKPTQARDRIRLSPNETAQRTAGPRTGPDRRKDLTGLVNPAPGSQPVDVWTPRRSPRRVRGRSHRVRSVSIHVVLKWTVGRNPQIIGLLLGEPCQLDSKLRQVQRRNFFVETLRKRVHLALYFWQFCHSSICASV